MDEFQIDSPEENSIQRFLVFYLLSGPEGDSNEKSQEIKHS
jgi:hypothetical protein